MKWVFLNPVYITGTESAFPRIACTEAIGEEVQEKWDEIRKRDSNVADNLIIESTSCWLDFGGSIEMNAPKFEIHLDGIDLNIHSRDVELYLDFLRNRGESKETFGGEPHYLVSSFHMGLLLSNRQCLELISTLSVLLPKAREIEESKLVPLYSPVSMSNNSGVEA